MQSPDPTPRPSRPSRALRRLAMAAVFLLGGLLALGGAVVLANAAERLTAREVGRALADARLGWAVYSIDGLGAHLEGQAPNEGARLAALRVVTEVVGAGRLSDAIEVPRMQGTVAPVFRIEAMRNQYDLSLIGLVPHAMGEAAIVERMAGISERLEVADMLQAADHPEPAGWTPAVDFAVEALRRLPVAQVSVTAGRIEVHALVDSADARQRLTRELREIAPRGQVLVLDLVAPRPVIAPFRLRLTRDATGSRMETCAADSETALAQIERAARAAGLTGRLACTIGLGAPSPRWGLAAERAIAALVRLPAGSVTLSDQSVLLEAPHDTDPDLFDSVVGRLESGLPEAFVLSAAILPPPDDAPAAATARPDFRVLLTDAGQVTVAGRLPDALIRQAVDSYARARFGSQSVTMEARLDPDLPAGWGARVLAGLAAMTELHHGQLLVTDSRVELTGVSGNPDAATEVSGVLTARLGTLDGVQLRIDYDERLDPVAQEPNPERCERWVQAILARDKLNFAPGAARLDAQANAILDELAATLRNCGELELEISGHTDSQGSAEGNLRLSQARAEAVREGLALRAVLVGGIVARGYGQERPVADNATEAGREANRRIEIALIRPMPDLTELSPEERIGMEAALELVAQTPAEAQTRPAARPARPD